jgi:hypothetical protein
MCEMSHVIFLYMLKENKSKLRKSHLGVVQIVAWFILDWYIFLRPGNREAVSSLFTFQHTLFWAL